MRFVSIDPGKGGALVLIEDGIPTQFMDMPVNGKHVDIGKVARQLWAWNPKLIVIEKVGSSPQMGVSSAHNFGYNYGILIGLAEGMEVPCHPIQPIRWKTYHGLLKKPKDASRLKVIEMFPHLAEEFKLKKSVDKADATLLGLAWLDTVWRKQHGPTAN